MTIITRSWRRRDFATAAAAFMALYAPAALAGTPEIVDVAATKIGADWRFEVTVAHDDEGRDHYADAWRVVGPDGEVYGMRVVAHPHVDEQPFTRSLSGVSIPEGVSEVTVDAKDNVDGWGEPATFSLP